MRIRCTRTEMIGGGTSYRFRVPIEDNPRDSTGCTNLIHENGKFNEYVDLLHILTWTPEISAMQRGLKRYNEILTRQKQLLQCEMIKFARTVFPELEDYGFLSEYWYDFTLPSLEVWTEASLSDFALSNVPENALCR